jgi:hypothetical protein
MPMGATVDPLGPSLAPVRLGCLSECLGAQVFVQVSPMGISLPSQGILLGQPALYREEGRLSSAERGGDKLLGTGHRG